ncbi:MAG: sensor histidine kinase, partial [Trebonia sp.]
MTASTGSADMGSASTGSPKRRSLSLRARLLVGLIALTACFLIVMGVVSSLVLGRLEQDQFNDTLRLAARQPVSELAMATDGFAAAWYSVRGDSYGELTPSSPAADEMRGMIAALAAQPGGSVLASLEARASPDQPFTLTTSGGPPLRAAWRLVRVTRVTAGSLPRGEVVILVGRPVSDIDNQVPGLVSAELITGAVLLALLVVSGSWLIGRGLAPLSGMARTADVIANSGDLTARVPGTDSRQETGRLAAAINTMLDKIQEAFGARLQSERKVRQFAADASHELRTPLTTIRGYAELYRQGALGPGELPNAMRRIEEEAERMGMLVAELLELARLDRASSLDLTDTDLAALARDAAADARAVEPGRPVTADVPPSLVVTADEARIRQVLANLLGNVRAHTPPDTPATIRLYAHAGGAVLEVADSGPGMAADDAARAFDRFYRGSYPRDGSGNGNGHQPAPADDATGSGLGLSIVQAIATAHGGQARLWSAPGHGTTIQLWIPLHFPERTMAPASLPLSPVPAPEGHGHAVDGAPQLGSAAEPADPGVAAVQPGHGVSRGDHAGVQR